MGLPVALLLIRYDIIRNLTNRHCSIQNIQDSKENTEPPPVHLLRPSRRVTHRVTVVGAVGYGAAMKRHTQRAGSHPQGGTLSSSSACDPSGVYGFRGSIAAGAWMCCLAGIAVLQIL